MAAYTASVAGNWSAQATWGGSGPPGSGDTATINANVTMDVDVTLGTSPNNGTIAGSGSCQLVLNTGNLTIAAGKTLTMKGNIWLASKTLSLGAGSSIVFDNSGSGGSPIYKLASGNIPVLSMVGASGNYATITAISGQTWAMNDTGENKVAFNGLTATYAKFQRMATSATRSGFYVYDASTSAFSYCNFDSCGTVWFYNGSHTNITLTVDNCTWTNGSYGSEGAVKLQLAAAKSSGTRRFSGNSLDGGMTYVSQGIDIIGNVIQGFGIESTLNSGGYSMGVFRGNFMYGDGSGSSGNGSIIHGWCYRNYFVVNKSAGNPHFIAGTAWGANTPIEQNIFESQSPDLLDTGDCIMLNASCNSGGGVPLLRNNLVLAAKDGETSGQLLTIYSNDTITTQCTHNTVNVNTSAVGGVGKRAAFAFAEASNGTADQIPVLKSNIAFGTSASQGYLAERVQGTVKDIVTASGADYNWTYNTSAGDNGRGYEDKTGTGNLWTAGNASAAGADAHQGSGDPAFYAGTRNAAAWASARGYGSTFADALAAVVASPARIADLISYVFEGYRPTTSGTRTAGHDGMPVGAANWCNTARVGSHVAAWEATLSTFGITAS